MPFRSAPTCAPHYGAFGVSSYEPLPEHATLTDLRAAGIALPQDAVSSRRHVVLALTLAGLVLVAGPVLRRSRP